MAKNTGHEPAYGQRYAKFIKANMDTTIQTRNISLKNAYLK
jgi:hypothetical protein